MTDAEQERARVEKQTRDWERALKGGATGNPFATLCDTCHGRHAPPRNELCPRRDHLKGVE